jgi:uncharacterized protein YegL
MFQEAQPARRFPIYVLVDRSGSMDGQAMAVANQCLQLIKSDIEAEPRAVESAWVSVISYGDGARIDVPLAALPFDPPTLQASGSSSLGAALQLLNESLDRDVVRVASEDGNRADYNPLVLILIRSNPSDDWRGPAKQLRERQHPKASVVAVTCGPDVNASDITEITETVLLAENVEPATFLRLVLMDYGDGPIRTASNPPSCGSPLPPLPDGFSIPLDYDGPIQDTSTSLRGVSTSMPRGRLPIYILVDRSESAGRNLVASLSQGLKHLLWELSEEPLALEWARVSVISFGDGAHIEVPLTGLSVFHPQALRACGSCTLGDALRLLSDSIQRDVVPASAETRNVGDCNPLVVILLGSNPSDNWRGPWRSLREQTQPRVSIIPVICGSAISADVPAEMSEGLLRLENENLAIFQHLLRWIDLDLPVHGSTATRTTLPRHPVPPGGFAVVF